MTEELYIDNECVDLEPGTRLTMNFKSNLLGDISKITASNSQTIRLPKTSRNRRIMDNPSAVAYQTSNRYNRYKARYVRNGIEIVKVAYAVLLSASECYEVAIYWGVMAQFQAWIDKGGKLNELAGTESVAWNKDIATTTLSLLKSRGYGYASYDCGVSNTALTNIHPSVTAWWILEKISEQGGFTIEMPDKYKEALRAMAIPCFSNNGTEKTNESEALIGKLTHGASGNLVVRSDGIRQDPRGIAFISPMLVLTLMNFKDKLHLSIKGENGAPTFTITQANSSYPTASIDFTFVKFSTDGGIAERRSETLGSSVSKTTSGLADIFTFASISMVLDVDNWDAAYISYGPYSYSTSIKNTTTCDLYAWSNWDDIVYPSTYSIPPNLPEITQIDFIKAICGMLGIFAVADPANMNNLKFVSLDVLQENKAIAIDWSNKLVRGNDDEPKGVEFKINDYCRNNLFKYKEDDTVITNADGNLKINSEVLAKEKTVITLPFAASDGSKIPHYKLSTDGAESEKVTVKDRIMSLVDDGNGRALLTFAGLDFRYLLSVYYSTLSRMLNSAVAITERFTLNEADLKSLDHTIPFYLRQYGKYYGIISIQTSDNTCEVKAVQLPETKIEEVMPPNLIINKISVKPGEHSSIAISQYPLKTNLTINYEYYLIGTSGSFTGTKIFPKGASEVALMSATRLFDYLELRSVSPTYDDTYNYVIAE